MPELPLLNESKILILPSRRRLAEDIIEIVQSPYRKSRIRLPVSFEHTQDFLPSLRKRNDFDSLWFVFSSTREELQSDKMQVWLDENRDILKNIPLFAFKIVEPSSLSISASPIKSTVENLFERQIVVSSIFPGDRTKDGNLSSGFFSLQSEFFTFILLLIMGKSSNFKKWSDFIEDQDCIIHRSFSDKQKSIFLSPNNLSPELNALSYFDNYFLLRDEARNMWQKLTFCLESARTIDKSGNLLEKIREMSKEVAQIINETRLTSTLDGSAPKYELVNFAYKLQNYQRRITIVLENLIKVSTRRKFNDRAKLFEGIKEELSKPMMVILFGGFSSGKSTFLNALLGLGKNSKSKLPTSPKPETASVNILEYSAEETMIPEFESEIENLFFFSPPRKINQSSLRYKINKEGIVAFLSWTKAGAVSLDELQVDRFISDRITLSSKQPIQQKDFKFLIDCLNSNVNFIDEGLLKEKGAIIKLSNIRINKLPWMPDPQQTEEYFKRISEPEVALMIKFLRLKRNIEQLKSLRFVDTPGTDSSILAHHTDAKEFIDDNKDAPILYFFDGDRVSFEANVDNFDFLKESGVFERTFFIITKKSNSRTIEEETEVKTEVSKILSDFGRYEEKLFYVDSEMKIGGKPDADWENLETALKEFVDENRIKSFKERVRDVLKNPLDNMLRQAQEEITILQEDVPTRFRHAELAEKKAEDLRAMGANLIEKSKSIEKQLYSRPGTDFHREMENIMEDLTYFDCKAYLTKTKDNKLSELKEVLEPLDEWKTALKENLNKANRNLQIYIDNSLTEMGMDADFKITPAEPGNRLIMKLSKIKEKVAEDTHRSVLSYTDWMTAKVERLIELTKVQIDYANATVKHLFEDCVENYVLQLASERNRLNEQAQNMKNTAEVSNKIREQEEYASFYQFCLDELAAASSD